MTPAAVIQRKGDFQMTGTAKLAFQVVLHIEVFGGFFLWCELIHAIIHKSICKFLSQEIPKSDLSNSFFLKKG